DDRARLEVVVDAGDIGYRDRVRVEQRLTAGHGPTASQEAVAGSARPGVVLREHDGVELRRRRITAGAGRIAAERIVVAEHERPRGQGPRAALRAGDVEVAGHTVEDLGGDVAHLVGHDLLARLLIDRLRSLGVALGRVVGL